MMEKKKKNPKGYEYCLKIILKKKREKEEADKPATLATYILLLFKETRCLSDETFY